MERVLLLLILLAIIEIVALYCLKKYSLEKNLNYFVVGLGGYMMIAFLLSILFTYEKVGIANHGWNILTSLAGFLVGYLCFKEEINFMEFLGIIISIIGVFIMLKH
ncbi:hypothetical protein QKU48_gp0897 [Fadolivirus algeromassiliense]|jgi:multidrug transporter EmrE-like cation transporter|uniref:Small multidrug resistance protein n=1 Tax=Fadolivirus FV1/VV64 TaxID=3070911 RepID=A0A7D3V5R3_9VIRU|nr:hypothetical protein QKU48_gp0897 [Fadolivirus algeromassiliense]QKF94355.1 hypothetical protein Fadolivirus_1_897 [Fadolivirus FV1/VV64]